MIIGQDNRLLGHWLIEYLTNTPFVHYWQPKLNHISTFIDNIPLLEDPHDLVNSMMEVNVDSIYKFYTVVDKNANVFILRLNPADMSFTTYGAEPSLCVRLYPFDIVFVSKLPLHVTDEEMFNRYDKQLIQVYHSAPKCIVQDETDSISDKITRSLQEIKSKWQLPKYPL